MIRRTRAVLLLPLVPLLFTGCEQNVYRVEMEPQGAVLARKTSVERRRSGGEEERVEIGSGELAHLAEAYGVEAPPSAAEEFTFSGEFGPRLPNDLGGAGWILEWRSSLGSAWLYQERVRGDDDLAAQLARRREGVDRTLDLVRGWLGTELNGDAAGREALAKFDGTIRQDLWNVSLLLWQMLLGPDSEEDPTAWIPLLQYLAERDYVDPVDLPQWSRALADLNREQPSFRFGELVLLAVSRKLGAAPGELHPSVAKLADWRRSQESLRRYLRETKEFAAWSAGREPGDDPLDPLAMLGETALQGWLGNIFLLGADRVELALKLPAAPVFTSGAWQAEEGKVMWSGQIPPRDDQRDRRPLQLFALWTVPDTAAQERHFGRVLLEGRPLAAYCRWYRGLAPHEARRWDAFLHDLRPGPELAMRLERFRFLEDPADPESPSLADPARALLLEALGQE